MINFREAKNTRREFRGPTGKMRGGKLQPVMGTVLRGSEGGMLSQSIMVELGPIPGRLLTQVTLDAYAIAVPVQALDALKNPLEDFAGMTEVVREKLLAGPIFGTETEGLISKALDVNPKSVAGVKVVGEYNRLAYIAAVNYLRQRKYVSATLLPKTHATYAPALYGSTALERLNGVLNPEDRVNGAVRLSLPTMRLPVQLDMASVAANTSYTVEVNPAGVAGVPRDVELYASGVSQSAAKLFAQLNGQFAGDLSLTDFYNAQRMDELTRQMRQIVDNNPEYGQEMALRWAHGLTVDAGKTPWILAERSIKIGADLEMATDTAGVNDETMRSDLAGAITFTVPCPKTELGYMVVTIISVRPDETLQSQPHPFLCDPWGLDNFVADELDLDPVAVTVREVYSDTLQANENNVVMYTGLNALKQNYQSYGFTRNVNSNTVEAKTAIWQVGVPLSVTPDNVSYPDLLSHYPFADNLDTSEPITYSVVSSLTTATPLTFGPSPVEELAIIETADIFDDLP